MANNTGREGEEALFEIIRSPRRPDDLNEADDGSQYLENTGGDDKIFDLDDWMDEVMNYDYDDEENVDLEITETGEVYLYKQASGDHHMFLMIWRYINESIFLLSALRIEQIFYRQLDNARPEQKVKAGRKVQHRCHQT